MIKKIGQSTYGVASYTITSITDLPLLPKEGIATGSTAIFPNGGNLKVYMFTLADSETTGTWDELV